MFIAEAMLPLRLPGREQAPTLAGGREGASQIAVAPDDADLVTSAPEPLSCTDHSATADTVPVILIQSQSSKQQHTAIYHVVFSIESLQVDNNDRRAIA